MEPGQDRRPRALVQGMIAVAALTISSVGMLWRLEPFVSWYYPLAWWPFILGVDALVLSLQGHSLLTRNPREFLLLSAISVPFWLVFEACNLVMKNWYYIGVTSSVAAAWFGHAVSFATVLPAVFEATELVAVLGMFPSARVRPIRVTTGVYSAFWFTGTLCLLFPLVLPRYTFPIIWVSFVFLLEPFNHRWAKRSLLREWEEGSMRTTVRLLMAGLICGFVWEAFNYRALTKWIYTVPFFEELKLFEMPLAGFLGFPPFAVECYVVVQFIGIFRGGKGWEPGDQFASRKAILPRGVWGAIWALTTAGCLFMFHLIGVHTVNSLHPRLADLRELAPEEVSLLQESGADRLDLWVQKPGFQAVKTEVAGLSEETVLRWKRLAHLVSVKGMGTGNLKLLWESGVRSVGDLERQNPEELIPKLQSAQDVIGSGRQRPTGEQVRLWVREARRLCRRRSGDEALACD